jgi:hypothetical protein
MGYHETINSVVTEPWLILTKSLYFHEERFSNYHFLTTYFSLIRHSDLQEVMTFLIYISDCHVPPQTAEADT